MTTPETGALTVSLANCRATIGMSWPWVLRFAREHDVPVWRLGHKTVLVPARQLLAALEQAAASVGAEPTEAEELAAMKRDFARELAESKRK